MVVWEKETHKERIRLLLHLSCRCVSACKSAYVLDVQRNGSAWFVHVWGIAVFEVLSKVTILLFQTLYVVVRGTCERFSMLSYKLNVTDVSSTRVNVCLCVMRRLA